jgi:hypothetical protein
MLDEQRPNVAVEGRRDRGRFAIFRACREGRDDDRRREKRAPSHIGRTKVVGFFPVTATYESKMSCLTYFGLCTPSAPPRVTMK